MATKFINLIIVIQEQKKGMTKNYVNDITIIRINQY